MAPSAASFSTSSTLWRAARVMTTRLPARADQTVCADSIHAGGSLLQESSCAPASISRRAICSPSCGALIRRAGQALLHMLLPSTEVTQASSTISPRSMRAQAPMGTWQPPCSAASSARSAMMAARVSASSSLSTADRRFRCRRRVSTRDGALPDGGHENFRRENFGDAVRSIPGGPGRLSRARWRRILRRPLCAVWCPRCRAVREYRGRRADAEVALDDASCWCPRARPARKFASVEPVVEIRQSRMSSRRQTAGKLKPRGSFRGNVFDAVDRKVDGLVEQRVFQFLDENSLSANLRQRRLLHFVAGGFDDDDFGFDARDRQRVACARTPPAIWPAGCRAFRCADASLFLPIGKEQIAQRFHVLDLAPQFFFAAQALRRLQQ